MKKNKILYRAWFWSYFALVLGGVLAALLSAKLSGALAIIMTVLAFVDLGLIIAGRVLYVKNRPLFPWFAYAAMGLLSALILFGFVLEIVYTAQGKPAVYAWVMGSISLVGVFFIDWAAFDYAGKIRRGEKIIEGKQ